ncbi:MAG TPA: 6-phosphogluconolactonase [Candidatus Saccharimonadales bacterium]|nr:6-phosphogluconolactonase [Candidatus Saccharimonadales bacterium]
MDTRFPVWVGSIPEAVAGEAERRFVEALRACSGRFGVAFSGGQTPRRLCERLAESYELTPADWAPVDLFQVDERCVPPEHPGSNFRMLTETLLARAPIPTPRIHRLRGELPPPRAAALAEAEWRDLYPDGTEWPELDFVILGMGLDGHTASLFPGTQALQEEERWVVENYVPQLDGWRLTLTFPVLARARAGVVLVTGEDKAATLQQVLDPALELDLPICRLLRANPALVFLADRDAASGLDLPPDPLDELDLEDLG